MRIISSLPRRPCFCPLLTWTRERCSDLPRYTRRVILSHDLILSSGLASVFTEIPWFDLSIVQASQFIQVIVFRLLSSGYVRSPCHNIEHESAVEVRLAALTIKLSSLACKEKSPPSTVTGLYFHACLRPSYNHHSFSTPERTPIPTSGVSIAIPQS